MYSFVSVDRFDHARTEQLHALVFELAVQMKEKGYVPRTNVVLYDLEPEEKERIVLGHSEKLALAFGLVNTSHGEVIRITKNLRLCEDCHEFTKFISKFAGKEILQWKWNLRRQRATPTEYTQAGEAEVIDLRERKSGWRGEGRIGVLTNRSADEPADESEIERIEKPDGRNGD
ncbi:Pentatricopeptide repeat-containing protein At3g46790, chloroplastic [Linum grandiflorum]